MHPYTVSTSHGDVHLTTPNHHTQYDSVREWIKDHKEEVATAIGVSSLAVSVLGVWLSHGRAGSKIH